MDNQNSVVLLSGIKGDFVNLADYFRFSAIDIFPPYITTAGSTKNSYMAIWYHSLQQVAFLDGYRINYFW